MRVDYTGTVDGAASSGTITLADTPDPIPLRNLVTSHERLFQTVNTLRGIATSLQDRMNRKTSVSFDTTRLFTDLASAQNFLLTHELSLPGSGTLVFYFGIGASTGAVSLQNCVLENYSGRIQGCTTLHQYRFSGGLFTTVTL